MRAAENTYLKEHYRPAPAWVWIMALVYLGILGLAAFGLVIVFDLIELM